MIEKPWPRVCCRAHGQAFLADAAVAERQLAR